MSEEEEEEEDIIDKDIFEPNIKADIEPTDDNLDEILLQGPQGPQGPQGSESAIPPVKPNLKIDCESQTEVIDDDDKLSNATSDDIIKNEDEILDNIVNIIDDKKHILYQSKSILELKYNKYKWHHNFWNITTILLSSSLTFIESAKLVFIDDDSDISQIAKNFFTLSPIILGTVITCCASIIKFKKYQERMEEIYIVIDKCITIISKLKNKKDEITLLKNKEKEITICKIEPTCTNEERSGLKKTYKNEVLTLSESFKKDIINEISTVYQETERYISYRDYDKHLDEINKTMYKKHILTKDKESFFDEYIRLNKHIMEEHRLDKIRKNVLKGKKVDKYNDNEEEDNEEEDTNN